MAIMSVRSTYALDTETAQSVKRLARTWGVSQAEVIRRSVRQATSGPAGQDALSPTDVIAHYRAQPLPRSREKTMRAIRDLRAQRHADDDRRIEHNPP
ncbi:MAG: hypothetical protein ACRETW_07665 [Stenotrophobium sp.]